MKSIEFEHGKVYFYDYSQGYIMRFNKMSGTNIDILSSFSLPNGKLVENQNGWSSNSLTGPKTRLATYKEIRLLEQKEGKTLTYEIY